jgi:hypothetical protein
MGSKEKAKPVSSGIGERARPHDLMSSKLFVMLPAHSQHSPPNHLWEIRNIAMYRHAMVFRGQSPTPYNEINLPLDLAVASRLCVKTTKRKVRIAAHLCFLGPRCNASKEPVAKTVCNAFGLDRARSIDASRCYLHFAQCRALQWPIDR